MDRWGLSHACVSGVRATVNLMELVLKQVFRLRAGCCGVKCVLCSVLFARRMFRLCAFSTCFDSLVAMSCPWLVGAREDAVRTRDKLYCALRAYIGGEHEGSFEDAARYAMFGAHSLVLEALFQHDDGHVERWADYSPAEGEGLSLIHI